MIQMESFYNVTAACRVRISSHSYLISRELNHVVDAVAAIAQQMEDMERFSDASPQNVKLLLIQEVKSCGSYEDVCNYGHKTVAELGWKCILMHSFVS